MKIRWSLPKGSRVKRYRCWAVDTPVYPIADPESIVKRDSERRVEISTLVCPVVDPP